MIEWLTVAVTLPRWVVWGALLTSPATWSKKFRQLVEDRLPGN